MGKKIFLIIILFYFQLLSAELTEFGKIVDLSGDLTISRNNKIVHPINSSRVYLGETIKTGAASFLKIKSDSDNYLLLNEQTAIKILSAKNFLVLQGELYIDSYTDEEFIVSSLSQTTKIAGCSILADTATAKKLTVKNKEELPWINQQSFFYTAKAEQEKKNHYTALGRTSIFPGWGHYYLENKLKAYPMFLASSYLLYNALTINPGSWSSDELHEIMYNKKQQFQQIYLAYWLWAMFDTYYETNLYNNRLTLSAREIKLSVINKNF